MLVKVGGTEVDIRVEAVMSVPRLGFMSNFYTWAQALMPLGIRPTMMQGAFWSQCLSRVCQDFIDKAEFLLVIDYDSAFSKRDVEELFSMALAFQCDALAPLQTKREDGRPMLTLKGTLENPPKDGHTTLPSSWFAEPVQEVDTAHFGCTILSTAALKRCKLPWMQELPNSDGTWDEKPKNPDDPNWRPRRDSDIAFWANWRESGNRVYVTPRVCIGHGEYVFTWPGKDLGKPVYQHATEYCNSMTKPDTAWSVPQ